MKHFSIRRFDNNAVDAMIAQGIERPLAQVFAARGVRRPEEISLELAALIPPHKLKNAIEAGRRIAEAIEQDKKIVIIGDYDCDGATATAIAVNGLHLLGARQVSYIIPNRELDGYGLSISLVERARDMGAQLIITVDNGISAIEGVAFARACGIETIVTDHHLPAQELPDADCIVNPNQPGDESESKSMAGCGVIFYVLMAARSVMRERGLFTPKTQPNLLSLIDLVAIGTVADVVPLDQNNRIMVNKGLERMRKGILRPGVAAILCKARKNSATVTTTDLGFSIAPRINAAGRLGQIETGIECLLAHTMDQATELCSSLDSLNEERKQLEKAGLKDALMALGGVNVGNNASLCFYHEEWQSGIVGLVASRLREQSYRPTICFANSNEINSEGSFIKGSGRSIPGVHMRDVLDNVSKREPGLIVKFGGHAQAAGLTIRKDGFERFKQLFEEEVKNFATVAAFQETIETDGELTISEIFNMKMIRDMRDYVWGQGFPEPLFMNRFQVVRQELLQESHLRLRLRLDGVEIPAIWFRRKKEIPEYVTLAYRLSINEWKGRSSVQLIVHAMETTDDDVGL